MRIWWVSQDKTFGAEFSGGYMWAPKTNTDGRHSRSYDNMTEVRESDVVLSFARSTIVAAGIVKGRAQSMPRPKEYGRAGDAWNEDGWLVQVDYHALQRPFRPADHIDTLRPLLPPKNSPLQTSGRGNQAYLFEITGPLGDALLGLADLPTILDVEGEAAEVSIRNRTDIPATKKQRLIEARIGQGIYRLNLEGIEKRCRLTGISDRRFLVASHIKPWSISTDFEKLDGNNGLLLAPHVDRLFDRGFISFEDNGKLLCRADLPPDVLSSWGLSGVKSVGKFSTQQAGYLAFHRATIFASKGNLSPTLSD